MLSFFYLLSFDSIFLQTFNLLFHCINLLFNRDFILFYFFIFKYLQFFVLFFFKPYQIFYLFLIIIYGCILFLHSILQLFNSC